MSFDEKQWAKEYRIECRVWRKRERDCLRALKRELRLNTRQARETIDKCCMTYVFNPYDTLEHLPGLEDAYAIVEDHDLVNFY